MGNCLVKKLQSVVEDDNLSGMNDFTIFTTCIDKTYDVSLNYGIKLFEDKSTKMITKNLDTGDVETENILYSYNDWSGYNIFKYLKFDKYKVLVDDFKNIEKIKFSLSQHIGVPQIHYVDFDYHRLKYLINCYDIYIHKIIFNIRKFIINLPENVRNLFFQYDYSLNNPHATVDDILKHENITNLTLIGTGFELNSISGINNLMINLPNLTNFILTYQNYGTSLNIEQLIVPEHVTSMTITDCKLWTGSLSVCKANNPHCTFSFARLNNTTE